MVTRPYHFNASGPILPPASREARRVSGRMFRWRASHPVLSAIRDDIDRAKIVAITPTVPAPKDGES